MGTHSLGEAQMGAKRVHCPDSFRARATPIGIVALGVTIDVVSTIVGHMAVAGVAEWNVVVLTLTAWFSFPLAVILLKVAALAIVAIGGFVVWRGGGRWEICLAGPGALWTGIGVTNVLTIVTAL
jgi:hypothetical protein